MTMPVPTLRSSLFSRTGARGRRPSLPSASRTDTDSSDPFRVWGDRRHQVDLAHLAGEPSTKAFSFSSQCEFSPEHTAVERVEAYGTWARVRLARSVRGVGGPVLEVTLVRVGEDWLIDTIDDYYTDPGDPLMPDSQRSQLFSKARGMPSWRDLDLVGEDEDESDNPDPGSLFAAGWAREPVDVYELAREADETEGEAWQQVLAEARHNAEVVPTTVVDVGQFRHEGVLAVGDAGGRAGAMLVCSAQADPSLAVAQVVLATFTRTRGGKVEKDTRVAAVRAVLAEADPLRWKRAVLVPGGGHVVGVDSGSAAIVDAAAYLGMTNRQWTSAWRGSLSRRATLLGGESSPIGVITTSGWGDGGYGVYWGLDAHDQPVQLVVDYGVLREPALPPAVVTGDDE